MQDSFVAVHTAWRRLADADRALSYLRQPVVNRSRSVLRHRVVVDKLAPKLAPDIPSPEREEIIRLDRSALAQHCGPAPRQREVLALRYYADLSKAQIASTPGISRGAVKSHTVRAISSLRGELRKVDE